MGDRLIHGREDQPLPHGQAQQVSVSNLLGTVEPAKERPAQGSPIGGDGLVAVARMLGQLLKDRRSLTHGYLAGTGRGGVAQESSLGEGADRPQKWRRSIEPLPDKSMMHMILAEEREQEIDIQQIAR